MLLRIICGLLTACALFAASVPIDASDRGPSTPEERKQALKYIHDWQADPLGPHAKDQFGWVLKWFADVPDQTVHVCTILDKLPKGDKKDGATLFGAEFMGQAAFQLENPQKKNDLEAEYQAGVEAALNVYAALLKSKPKDQQPYLDDLVARREAGTLAQFVQDRAAASCKK